MLLLFVGGVMNLAWVALLGLIIIGQKFAPSSWRTTRWLAGLLAATALAVFLLP
jgi:predicted metal-binding membrane protein